MTEPCSTNRASVEHRGGASEDCRHISDILRAAIEEAIDCLEIDQAIYSAVEILKAALKGTAP